MEKRRYSFSLPNYQTFTDKELYEAITNELDRLKAEFSNQHGLIARSKVFASSFVRLSFLTAEMERRMPGIVSEIEEEIQLDIMLDALKINRNE